MLVARGLTKEYQSGTGQFAHRLTVLRDVTFDVPQGAFVSIVGPSGSGKTTLLGLLAGLDTPTRGTVSLDGQDFGGLDEDSRARLRGEKVGFVFQSFQLIPTLTAQENVQVPLELSGAVSARDAATRARDLLTRVGLGDRTSHFPQQLSGGEQQRVALARAFVNEPRILFADEPTGNLDGATGERIVELLQSLNRERGCTIVLVTHDVQLAARTQRTIRLRDGVIVEDTHHAPAAAPAAAPESASTVISA
jgi:putative ABC transport system ATP-binding protein